MQMGFARWFCKFIYKITLPSPGIYEEKEQGVIKLLYCF